MSHSWSPSQHVVRGGELTILIQLPDFQEILLAHAPADEVVPNPSPGLHPLPQEDEVGLYLLTQRLHCGYRRVHVLLIQTVVAAI